MWTVPSPCEHRDFSTCFLVALFLAFIFLHSYTDQYSAWGCHYRSSEPLLYETVSSLILDLGLLAPLSLALCLFNSGRLLSSIWVLPPLFALGSCLQAVSWAIRRFTWFVTVFTVLCCVLLKTTDIFYLDFSCLRQEGKSVLCYSIKAWIASSCFLIFIYSFFIANLSYLRCVFHTLHFPLLTLRKNYVTGTEEEREIGEKKGIFKSY